MRRFLIDANVVFDVIFERHPHFESALAVWTAVEGGRVEGMLAAHAVTTIFYVVAKQAGKARAHRLMPELLSAFDVAPEDKDVLQRAAMLDLPDFEDAVTAAAAEASGCEAIVTRDPAGFAGAGVRSISPALAMAMLADEVHEPFEPYDAPPVRRRRRRPRATEEPAVASTR